MAKCIKGISIIQGLWLLSIVLLASSALISARISGQIKDDSISSGKKPMATVGAASSNIAAIDDGGRNRGCFRTAGPPYMFCCMKDESCWPNYTVCQAKCL